jgi:hypothetical protein
MANADEGKVWPDSNQERTTDVPAAVNIEMRNMNGRQESPRPEIGPSRQGIALTMKALSFQKVSISNSAANIHQLLLYRVR